MNKSLRIIALFICTVTSLLWGTLAAAQGLTAAKLDAWLKGYEAAWETLDAGKAAALFSEDATYRDEAFAEPYQGREGIRKYWTDVTSDQKDVNFTYEVLAVTGNTGIAHWHAELTQPSSGSTLILDGIFVLDFAPDGLCKGLKEWWFIKINPPAKGN
ncbi:MAG: hypothetical protein HW386_1635 [Gammaproteobacteria bacterium]|nr:hypothetical protein [Gammaproteobacteria bacterium]